MDSAEKEEIPMLSFTRSRIFNAHTDAGSQRHTSRTRSVSMSISTNSSDLYVGENRNVSHTGPLRSERITPATQISGPLFISKKPERWPVLSQERHMSSTLNIEEYTSFNGRDNPVGKNEHLLRSGPLGKCNDPYCTTCPTYYDVKPPATSFMFDPKVHNVPSGDAEGWMWRSFSFIRSCYPGIMHPHTKFVQQWNKFFLISCLVAIFVDPLFFFLLSVQKDKNYETGEQLHRSWHMATAIAVLRSITDFMYFCHMLLQFRLAFVDPESRVVGAGELVDNPQDIALHYLYGYFSIDLFAVLPIPQILILSVLPTSPANYAKNLLRATVLLQYFPRFYRFLPLLAGHSASGFIFETASANLVLNLFICVLAGHVVGSSWYLFGLQRVNQCLRNACKGSTLKSYCKKFIDCGHGNKIKLFNSETPAQWSLWRNDATAARCFVKEDDFFNYGVYKEAVELTTLPSIITRYIYSFFWGFQQISTLAGNLVPSYFFWEVLFTICIVGLGLFLFALLVGNMQNLLHALIRRRLEMQLRRHDVEQWMRHRRLPEELRRHVRQSERFRWAATRGVNERELLENFPEDLQREIRRHLFTCIKKVPMFALMDDQILDAICWRLKQKLYTEGSKILDYGAVVDKLFFIVRGSFTSVDADGNEALMSEGQEGQMCGEELLSWFIYHSAQNKDGRKTNVSRKQYFSNRTVTCTSNVEAFSLRTTDLEEVITLFPRFLRGVQDGIRNSHYWRGFAASSIQAAWRYRRKRLSRGENSHA